MPPVDDSPSPTATIFGLIGLGLHLAVGFMIAASGLIAPYGAVVGLAAVWLAALAVGLREWRRRVWVAVAAPVVTFIIWIVVIAAGEAVLGWNA